MRAARLVPLLVLLAALSAAAQDFGAARKRFGSSFREGVKAADRVAAVEAVAAFDTRDAAKLLLSGVAYCQDVVVKVAEQRRVISEANDFEGRDPRPELIRLKEVADGELRVIEAIRKGLLGMKSEKALDYLRTDAFRVKSWKARQMAAFVLGAGGDRDSVEPLLKALGDKDARVRLAAAQALGKLKAAAAVGALVKLLSEKSWMVRAAAIDALGDIASKDCVGPLIEHLAKEEEARLRSDVAKLLAKLTGMKFGDSPEAWKRWWTEHAAEYGGPPPPKDDDEEEKPDAEDGGYYGLPVTTRKAIFILDISESMSYSAVDYREKPEPGAPDRLEIAKREFIRAITNFNSKGSFGLIVFNNRVKQWRKVMVKATKKNKEAAKRWVKALEPADTTNIYAALEAAFGMAGMGARDKNYAMGADTIYLMSDGAPTNEDASADDPERILRAVREWNQLGRVKIHTIGLLGHDVHFMSELARQNNGHYTAR